ncbi:ESX secretion-associated protein EspG [Sciscionella sediminilitoris]|uniref:ESX secretion-associated protein EspG n=1 Tax=Sciscionella sediminilitoris TaxID=1445613 RepID=UPI001E38EC3D|nr:ESX secretion-associated protein EspG [Sciscionella sp. SE31]
MARGTMSISHTAYEVLWERAELGAMPASIAIHYPLRTLANGATLAREAFTELAASGLAEDTEPHPELIAALRRLARAPRRYALMIITRDHPHGEGSLLAIDDPAAVLATLDEEHLHIRSLSIDIAIPTLLAELPAAPPGQGKSLVFHEDELSADGHVQPRGEQDSILVPPNTVATQADSYLHLMRRPRRRLSYLYRPVRQPIVIVDLESRGRWLVHNDNGWITTAPGTDGNLTDLLCVRPEDTH